MTSINFPLRYIPKNLTKRDKQKQLNMLINSKKLYKKNQFYTRKKIPSYKNKKSDHVSNDRRIYNIKNIY